MMIEKPLFLLLLLLVPLPWVAFRPRALYRFSSFVILPQSIISRIMAPLYRTLAALAIGFLSLALSGILLEFAGGEEVSEGALICLVRDRSGSMADAFTIEEGKVKPKMATANDFLERLVASYPKDKFCLIDFGHALRPSHLLVDQDVMLGILKTGAEPDMGGTEFIQPLERAINILYGDKSSTSKAIIMVSDGEAPIGPAERLKIVRWMRTEGIMFMWIAINSNVEWQDLYDVVQKLGAQGMVFRADNPAELALVFEKIKSLPRGLIRRPTEVVRYPLERIFNLAAYTCLGILGIFFLGELCVGSARKGGAL